MTETEDFIRLYTSYYGGKIKRPSTDFVFKRTSLPSVLRKAYKYYATDPDIIKLQEGLIEDTLAHRYLMYFGDNTATTYGSMAASVLVGDNLIVTCKSTHAEDIINDWNDNINVRGETIEDYVRTSFVDNLIDRQSLYRVFVNPKEDLKVDIQRVSMGNIEIENHPTLGFMRFIQRTDVPKYSTSKNEFYRRNPTSIIQSEAVVTIIPNEPNCALYIKLFDHSPVSSILDLLVKKKWAYWFMRKYMEKHWAPWVIGYVGDPKNNYMPNNPQELRDSLNWAADAIRKIRDFGGASFPATTRLETLDTKTSKVGNIYLDTIEHFSREIAIGLYGSISLREASGVLKADTAQEVYLRNFRYFREIYSILLRKLYANVVLPAYGVTDHTPRDIKITFPPLQTDKIKDVLQSVEIAAKIGVFKDFIEIRKILNPYWKHIDEKITPEDQAAMKKLFLELNSPSRAEGDVPQQRTSAKTTTKKPKK